MTAASRGWDGLVDVNLYGPAAGVAAIASLLASRGVVVERCEPHPANYQPGEHVWLAVRISERGQE